ncbi:hypothetical protein ACOME3_007710 [Neoechinorhynchus agilis]
MSGDSERESTNRVEPAALLFNKYVDADAFFSDALAVIQSTALASQQLPPRGEAFDYYQSFPRFADGMFISRVRLVSSINKLVRKFTSCRPLDAPTDPKLVDNKTTKSKREAAQREEEQMERIIEINDEITERINNQLDVICGLSKAKPVTPSARRKVVSSLQRAQNPAARFSANKDAGKKMRTGLCVVSIPKPQLNFKDKVDNKSNLQFVHRLTQKPHAIVPLHPILCKQLENPITEETIRQFPEILRHPYEAEIEAFNLTKDRLRRAFVLIFRNTNTSSLCRLLTEKLGSLESVTIQVQMADITPCVVSDTLKFTKDFQFVNDEISFDRMLITAEFSSKEIAMDLEHHDLRSFMGFTCLIQLSTRTSDYVIDAIEIRHVLHKLNRLTANPRILKVFHGSEMDVLWLQKDFGVYVVNMFDTHQAARLLNHPYLSLSYLLKHYCDFEAAKQYQRADWRQRPLPDVLLEYARADTHFLLYIYDRMRNELIERANGSDRLIRAVYERSKQICLSLFEKPRLRQESAYIASFNARQNQALKLLSEWRDRTAREDDESPEYILPKHMMLKIAEYLPKEKQGIFGCCNPVPAYIRQNLVQIHQLVLDARCVPLEPVSKRGQVADDRFLKLPTYDLDNPTECMFDSAHCDDQPIGRTLNIPPWFSRIRL